MLVDIRLGFYGGDYPWHSLRHDGLDHGLVPWNREAFVMLSQLYQMTVTDVATVPAVPITIAK